MIYRGSCFLAVVCFGPSPTPTPVSELSERGRGGGWGRSQIIRRRESLLLLYKSLILSISDYSYTSCCPLSPQAKGRYYSPGVSTVKDPKRIVPLQLQNEALCVHVVTSMDDFVKDPPARYDKSIPYCTYHSY